MAQFLWNESFSVGDPALDKQHQQLIEIMNELHDLLALPTETREPGKIEHVFDGLASYVFNHFAYEEKRMADAGVPFEQLATHRGQHETMLKQVRQFQARTLESNGNDLKDLMPYLYGEWLIHHICEEDMQYRPYVEAGEKSTSA